MYPATDTSCFARIVRGLYPTSLDTIRAKLAGALEMYLLSTRMQLRDEDLVEKIVLSVLPALCALLPTYSLVNQKRWVVELRRTGYMLLVDTFPSNAL